MIRHFAATFQQGAALRTTEANWSDAGEMTASGSSAETIPIRYTGKSVLYNTT